MITVTKLLHAKKNLAISGVVLIATISLFSLLTLSNKSSFSIQLVGVPQNVVPKGDDFYTIRSLLTQIAPVTYGTWNDTQSRSIDSHTSLLIFFDNNAPVREPQKKEIAQFVHNGGSAIFMVDGMYIPSGGKPTTASHNLFDFFTNYGIALQSDLVVSNSNEVASISTSQTAFASPYPLWAKTTNFNKTLPEFGAISHLVFPWSSSVKTVQTSAAKTNMLVRSEKNSWVQKEQFSLAPNEIPTVLAAQQRVYGLVAQATTNTGGQLLVIPSSRFAREQFLSTPPENTTFIANIARLYYTQSARTLTIARTVWTLIYFVITVLLATVFVIGIWRYIKAQRTVS